MTILPGLEISSRLQGFREGLAGMIDDLIEQANSNYLKSLAAAAIHNPDQAWDCYSESLALMEDITTLSNLHELVTQAAKWKPPL